MPTSLRNFLRIPPLNIQSVPLILAFSIFIFLTVKGYYALGGPSNEDPRHEQAILQAFHLSEGTSFHQEPLAGYLGEKPQLGVGLYLLSGLVWKIFGADGALFLRFACFALGVLVFFKFLKVYFRDSLDRGYLTLLFSTSIWWVLKYISSIDLTVEFLLTMVLLYLAGKDRNRRTLSLFALTATFLFHCKISSIVFLAPMMILFPERFDRRLFGIIFLAFLLNFAIFLLLGGFPQLESRAVNQPFGHWALNLEGIAVVILAPWSILREITYGSLAKLAVSDYLQFAGIIFPFLFVSPRRVLRGLLASGFIAFFILVLARKDHASYGMKAYSSWLEIALFLGAFRCFLVIDSKKLKKTALVLLILSRAYETNQWTNALSSFGFVRSERSLYQEVENFLRQSRAKTLLTFCNNNVSIAEFYLGDVVAYKHYALGDIFPDTPPPLLVDGNYVRNSLALIPNDCLGRFELTRDSDVALRAHQWIKSITDKKYMGEIRFNRYETYSVYHLK